LFLAIASLDAQGAPPRVVVRDSVGTRIPYASVQVGGSNPRTASDSGVVVLSVPRADSLKLLARRVGFEPFEGWVRPDDAGDYSVPLRPRPRNLNRASSYSRDTPLARAGFYDRMERVARGAMVGRFWTPEALELRNASRTSSIFEGDNVVRIRWADGKPVLMGRGGSCPMAVLLDGQPMPGMVEELGTRRGHVEIWWMLLNGMELARAERAFIATHSSIDELVNPVAVVAVEVYPSVAGAPPELQRTMASEVVCGIIALWTER